jgi:hypothetical protein
MPTTAYIIFRFVPALPRLSEFARKLLLMYTMDTKRHGNICAGIKTQEVSHCQLLACLNLYSQFRMSRLYYTSLIAPRCMQGMPQNQKPVFHKGVKIISLCILFTFAQKKRATLDIK